MKDPWGLRLKAVAASSGDGGKVGGHPNGTTSQARMQNLVFYCMHREELFSFLKQECIKLYL